MKKILSLMLLTSSIGLLLAQNFNMAAGSVNIDCNTGGVLFDSGGAGGNYAANQNIVMTVCPSAPGFGVFATMDLMDIQPGDQITIYNGNSTAAPTYPDMPLDNGTAYNVGAQFQSTVANASGCLTFEFISNGDANLGSFEFSLECEARCQTLISQITSAIPDTVVEGGDVFVNICLGDTLFVNANALFPENNTEYAQSEASSEFSWNWGDNSPIETGQVLWHYFDEPGGYLANLTVIDINGCRNYQDQLLKVRVAPIPEFLPLLDSLLCLGQTDTLSALPEGLVINGQVVQGDTVYFIPPFFSGDSLFLPDGNGAGYNSNAFLTSFGPSDVITNCGNILDIGINIEHSFLGDLEITLTCPNGQSAILKSFASGGGGTYLGNPFDNGAIQVGSGLEYHFNTSGTTTLVAGPTQAATNTAGNTVVPGDYLPEQAFTNFIGCPINGQWTLNITDNLTIDDGFLFNWELNIAPCMFPQVDSFTMLYDFGYWDPAPSIIGIVNTPNNIIIEPDSVGPFVYTYHTENQFGCEYEHEYSIYTNGFSVNVTPEDTSICGDSLQLMAELVDVPLQCEPSYTVSTIPIAALPITGFVGVALTDDALSNNIAIPFPFEFFCETKPNFKISSNGLITFTSADNGCCSGELLPLNDPFGPNDVIALFWEDLNPGSGGQIGHFTVGTAPNRIKVIAFNNVPHFGGGSLVSGQIQLYETSNIIEIHCTSCNSDGGTHTIGIENALGSVGYAAPGHNASSASAINQAFRFSPSNSLGNYSFNWSPAVNISNVAIDNPLVWPTVNTNYIVSVTNVTNNCTYTDTAMIEVGGAFEHGISNDTFVCRGESVQLEATGGALTFAWTPNDGSISDTTIANPIFSPLTTTTYTVGLDSFSCVTFESVTVYVSQLGVDSTVVLNESCAGAADGSIQIFASGQLGPVSYSIDNGINFFPTNLFQNLAAGFYDIIVMDSVSCDTSYQVEILGGSPLNISSVALVEPLCGNVNDGTILIHPGGGLAPFTFSIDSGVNFQADSLFVGLAGGQYDVFLQDALGCIADTSITLNQPDTLVISVVQVDSLSCFQSGDGAISVSAVGGVPAYEFAIDGGAFGAGTSFAALDTGTHVIYVRDLNFCVDSILVDVYQPDSLIITNVQVDSTLCFNSPTGSSISFDGLGGTQPYTFSVGLGFVSTNVFTDLAAQTYSLQVQDANLCLSALLDTSVLEPNLLEFVLDSTKNATCGFANGEIHVSALGGTGTYQFSLNGNPSQASGHFLNLTAGNYSILITDGNTCDTAQLVVLDGFPAAQIGLVAVDSVSCYALSDGSLEVQALGGTAPFEFSINNGALFQSSAVFSGLAANTYQIIVRDSVACFDTLTVEVFEPLELILTGIQTSVLCFGESNGGINLSVIGGTSAYQFSITNDLGLQNSNSFSGILAGAYTAYVVDQNSCRDSISISVLEPALFEITSTNSTDISCFGDANGSISIVLAGGVPAYSYSLDSIAFQASNNFGSLNGGAYTIYALDANGCSATAQDSIYEPLALIVNLVNANNVSCNGGANGSIQVLASQGVGPYQYSLTGAAPFQTGGLFNNLVAGSYTITVKDANNCTTTISQVITQPNPLVVNFSSTNLACFGDLNGSITINTISGETAPYSISFNGAAGVNFVPGLTFSNLSAGLYNFAVTDVNACPVAGYSQNVTISSPTLFELDTVIYSDPLCDAGSDGAITLVTNGGGVPAYSYNIFVAGDTLTNGTGVFPNLVEGDYAVWVVDQNGCSDLDLVSLVAPPPLSVDTDRVFNASCWSYEDGQIWVVGIGGTPYTSGTVLYDFTLEDGTVATLGTFTNLAEGTYTVIVSDANGCEATREVFVGEPDPVFAEIFPQDTLIEMGDTLSLSVVPTNALGTDYIYVWSPLEGLSCTDCANPLVSINNDTEFTLTFYDENGCFTTTTVFVYVSDSLRYFVPNAFTPGNGDNNNDVFKVYGQDIKYVEMMIYNRWGEKIFEDLNALSFWDGTYKGELQNPGVYTYFVKITFLNDENVEQKGSVTLLR